MVATIGGVVQPGMDLIEIVPLEGSLLVEAHVRPADIAFLRPEQDAKVKLTAYDYAIYGGLAAKLEHISADTITDENGESFYLIKVRTDKDYLGTKDGSLKIISGMTATVDILTGEKSVLDYILKPVLRAREKALRER
jgi:adhesin transport system membrane fusion protein